MSKAPERIWIDFKRANDCFAAYDERPNEPYNDCQEEYVRADRVMELEAEVKKQALQYLCDAGQLGERVGELTSVLEEVDAWVEGLGYYADESAELVTVFRKVKAVLGKGYKRYWEKET